MIFSPPNLPQSPFDVRPGAYNTPGIGDGLPQNQPFVWGAGGARLTPEQLLAEQEMARDRMKSDYSPVSSVWQGLGRVADNWLGALDARRFDKEQVAATERSNSVLQGLMNSPDQGSLISAASDPYLNSGARDVATLLLKNSLPKRKEYDDFQNRLIEGGILPGTQEWIDANRGAAMNTSDPIINATVGGRDFFGPRSLLQSEIGKGGDPQSGGGGGQQPPPSSAFQPDMILNNAKLQGFISPEDYASLQEQLGPNGKMAMDGWLNGSGVKIGQKVDGKMYYQINGKWYDNPEGR